MEFMYITNNSDIAKIAEKAGVDRIWVDLERNGKEKRQPGNTVKSNHFISDIPKIKSSLSQASVHVRINPIFDGSKHEIDAVINSGADIIMLPYYKTVDEVKVFLDMVDGRVKTSLLLETKEAHRCLKDTLQLSGIDEIYVGLNDLHISYQKRNMFELLIDGTVENICMQLQEKDMSYGIGGMAGIGQGDLPAEYILTEYFHLGSSRVILSRSFLDIALYHRNSLLYEERFIDGVKRIREYEENIKTKDNNYFLQNRNKMRMCINEILKCE